MRIDKARVLPAGTDRCLDRVQRRGVNTQILGVPRGSTISNIVLESGASHASKWACLRAAVIKFDETRANFPVNIAGRGLIVPSAHTLMDYGRKVDAHARNENRLFPYQMIDNIGSEIFYLVHASYCHPDQLFLPQGTYTKEKFCPIDIYGVKHKDFRDGTLFLAEVSIDREAEHFERKIEVHGRTVTWRSFNILEGLKFTPTSIVILLKEGGHLLLQPS